MIKLSSIVGKVTSFFKGFFSQGIPTLEAEAKNELSAVENSLLVFIGTDLGKLAIDAVGVAAGVGKSGDPAFAAAKSQFIADAKVAGHDLENIGSGVVDWMIQTAYTYISGVSTNISKAVPPPVA